MSNAFGCDLDINYYTQIASQYAPKFQEAFFLHILNIKRTQGSTPDKTSPTFFASGEKRGGPPLGAGGLGGEVRGKGLASPYKT